MTWTTSTQRMAQVSRMRPMRVALPSPVSWPWRRWRKGNQRKRKNHEPREHRASQPAVANQTPIQPVYLVRENVTAYMITMNSNTNNKTSNDSNKNEIKYLNANLNDCKKVNN